VRVCVGVGVCVGVCVCFTSGCCESAVSLFFLFLAASCVRRATLHINRCVGVWVGVYLCVCVCVCVCVCFMNGYCESAVYSIS